jgi:glycosyltransferase involved in cell wall biosynthesis
MRQDRVHITGYADATVYADYLLAADVAVQLRSMSRGETSAAALDCLSAGLPTIVNAHGTMAELPADVAWQLKDEFSVEDLTLAIEILLTHDARRKSFSQAAEKYIQAFHAPAHCALEYQKAIENFYSSSQQTALEIANGIAHLMPLEPNTVQALQWAEAISLNFPGKFPLKRLFLDITATRETTRHTGIERVASSLARELLMHPPAGFRVEPVHLSFKGGRWHARYATQVACQWLSLRPLALPEDVVEPQAGDLYVTLDLASGPFIQASQSGLFEQFRQRGVLTHALVYDLLPVRLPEVFPPGADIMHSQWLRAISKLDGALCISKSVKADLQAWQSENQITWRNRRPFSVAAFELGADLSPITSSPLIDAVKLESLLGQKPTGKVFLSVGTLEPRKNFAQTLKAFELLWLQNMEVSWILVGREGWTSLSDHQRQDIHSLIQHLQSHPEMGKRLFWLNDVQDAQLAQLYDQADCLLNASLGEGLGLPLIEAARQGLPLLLTDLPVFKEVAGQSATYFNAKSPEKLANAIECWVNSAETERPDVTNIKTMSWAESKRQFLSCLGLLGSLKN